MISSENLSFLLGVNAFYGETIIPKGMRGSQLSFKFTIRKFIKGVSVMFKRVSLVAFSLVFVFAFLGNNALALEDTNNVSNENSIFYDFSDNEQLGNFFRAGPDNAKFGDWTVNNGMLQVKGTSSATNWRGTSFLNKYQYSNFTMEFDAEVSSSYGIILRAQDDGSSLGAGLNKWHSGDAYVIFHYTDSNSKIQVFNYNGEQTKIGDSVSDESVHGVSSLHWVIECSGNMITYTVTDRNNSNNSVNGSFTDDSYSVGYLGFFNLTKAGVTSLKVDNLMIIGEQYGDPDSGTIWYDDFSGSTGRYYTAYGGYWNNRRSDWTGADYSGVLGNENLVDGITYYYLNDFEMGNVSVEYDINKYYSAADFGIVLRAATPNGGPNDGNGYTVMYDGNWIFAGRIDGKFTQIKDGTPYAYNPGNDGLTINHLKVSVEGDLIKIYVNRMAAPVITVRDSTFKAGYIGIRTSAASNVAENAVFDNLRVRGNIKGDINSDLQVDIRDLVGMKKYAAEQSAEYNADSAEIDGDGSFGTGDMARLTQYLLGNVSTVYNY